MKKSFVLPQVLFILLFFCSCDPYVYKQPDACGDNVWKCENPEITYVVKMEYSDEHETDIPVSYAITSVNDEEITFYLRFLGNTARAIELDKESMDQTGNILFYGTCKYSKTKFTIKVDTESDILFNGKYDELVFVRQKDEEAG